ncbi:recombinase family protein, partial [Streptomyces albidoflavus]|uniref:recombinase family protein n=1 Tax=Streptomyces albidoflavus TaxID=1886 RepID=UPI00331F2115
VELSQALCDRNGWSVVAVIVEKDTSASTKRGAKRSDEWEHVKALVEDGTADAIVSRHFDRMYRTPWDLEDLVDLAESTGVTLAAAQARECSTCPPRPAVSLLASALWWPATRPRCE